MAQLVKQLTHDPKVKGLKPASVATGQNCTSKKQYFHMASTVAQLVEQFSHDSMFEGLNPAAAATG